MGVIIATELKAGTEFKMSVLSRFVSPQIRLIPCVKKSGLQVRQFYNRGHGGAPRGRFAHLFHNMWDIKMNIRPTEWSMRYKNDLWVYWAWIFIAPAFALGTGASIFIGNASIAPIPEGYEPKEWEYERNPITRWMVRNVWKSEQCQYEIKMHEIWAHRIATQRKQLKKGVQELIKRDGDYAAWSYQPASAYRIRYMNKVREDYNVNKGNY